MFFNELPNNTSQQLPLIIVGFGFTPAQSALFNIAKPLWGSFLILVSAAMLYATDLGVGYTCAISYIPCFVGGIIMVSNRLLRNRGFADRAGRCTMVEQDRARCWHADIHLQAILPAWPLLGRHHNHWVHQEAVSHVNVRCCSCCCKHDLPRVSLHPTRSQATVVDNTRFWQEKYKPRYILPWSFMTAFWLISPAMCIIIRFYLQHENKVRATKLEQQGSDSEEDALDTGDGILRLNDKDLDQTDRENLRFVYPL